MKNFEIIEVDMLGQVLTVENVQEVYHVKIDGVIKHYPATADDVIRVLGHYIHSLNYKLEKANGKND